MASVTRQKRNWPIRTRIAKLVDQMEKEDGDLPRSLMTRLHELEQDEDRLQLDLTILPERTVVRLSAN